MKEDIKKAQEILIEVRSSESYKALAEKNDEDSLLACADLLEAKIVELAPSENIAMLCFRQLACVSGIAHATDF